MATQSYWELNVSRCGQHAFATAERSVTTNDQLVAVGRLLRDKFPAEEGWQITCTYWCMEGTRLNLDEVLHHADHQL